MNTIWPWLTLVLLGPTTVSIRRWAGCSPWRSGERSCTVVLRAFLPIALGHAMSVGVVAALVVAAQGQSPCC